MSKAKKLTKKQLNELKDIILAERERIQNKLHMEQSQVISEGDKDEVDQANNEILRRTELRFATREALYLKKLIKTLEMIDSEDYGMCEDCGVNINFTRLKARPTSTMCIVCKEESEREELRSFNGRISKSLTKSMNL